MIKKAMAVGIAASAILLSAVPVLAAQGAVGAIFSGANPGEVGPTISGDWYGNTSNPSGNGSGVLPSLAPGPWKCNYTENNGTCYGPTDPGGSMGTWFAPLASGGVATPVFANGNDPNIDFSAH